MNARRLLLLLAILILTALPLPSPPLSAAWQRAKEQPPPKQQTIAFVGVNVVPMDRERVLTAQTVVVENGRIAAMGPADKTAVPDGSLRVEARGKYLLPGLADLHVHLQVDEQDNLALFDLFLANGVTTILNLYGTPHHLDLRERIRRGELLAPSLHTSGPYISNAPYSSPSAEEVERMVVEQKRAGYDIIKIHGDFSRETYRKLLEVARREKIRVIGHAPRNLGIEVLLEERQHAVAHSEEYLYAYFFKSGPGEDKAGNVPVIAEATAKAGVWVIPNLTAYKGIWMQAKDIVPVLKRPEVQYVPASIAEDWAPERNTYVRRFNNPLSVRRFEESYRLLEALVLQQTGTVAAGKRADLILLGANPLDDIRNTTKCEGVMAGGRWLPGSQLRQLLNKHTNR